VVVLLRQEELTTREKEMVERLRQLHAEIDLAYLLVQQFLQMVRTLTGERLDAWLAAVASSSLTDLQSFANRVLEDKEAVFAGLTRKESNGPTEGHITRLKLIKREPGTVVPTSICSDFGFSPLPKRERPFEPQRPDPTTNHERGV
jgi:transposase